MVLKEITGFKEKKEGELSCSDCAHNLGESCAVTTAKPNKDSNCLRLYNKSNRIVPVEEVASLDW